MGSWIRGVVGPWDDAHAKHVRATDCPWFLHRPFRHKKQTNKPKQARKFLTSIMIKHHPEEVISTSTSSDEEEAASSGKGSLDSLEARCVRACVPTCIFVCPSRVG